jgi:type III secretory pathway component EscU
MKNIALKSLFLLPALFIVDYILMISIGCVACFFGYAADFYECTFCNIGKIVLVVSLVAFVVALIPDVKSMMRKPKVDDV